MSVDVPTPALGSVSPDTLAELIATFTDATGRLQETHETLRAEVSRLESELRDTRGQLARARELAALGEMAAGIAHEIRNPLGSIKLYARMLVEDLPTASQERGVASKIARAVDGLNAVVGDVLTFSREIRLDPRPMEPSAMCDRALECCADVISAHAIDVQRRSDDHGAEALADPSLSHQALVNVLRNACEAIEDREVRRLRVTSGVRTVLTDDGGSRPMARVLVEDSGPGIPDDVRERVFNPFFTTRATGTGLGLPIVHRILDAHGGRVVIRDGAPGLGGAAVELLFPRHLGARTHTNESGEAA